MFNTNNLDAELRAAGISISGCDSSGKVWDVDGETEIQRRPDVVAVLAVHDPWEYGLSPQMPLVKVGGVVLVNIKAAPGNVILLIDGIEQSAAISDDGLGTITFEVASAGEYVVTGKTGKLAQQVAVVKAVE